MNYSPIININGHDYRYDILAAIDELLQYAIIELGRVFFIRLDIHFPAEYEHNGSNEEISKLMHHLRQHYGYHGIGFFYLWAREQDTSKNPHYHVIFLLDGRLAQHNGLLYEEIRNAWFDIVGMTGKNCIHRCNPDVGGTGIMIHRPGIRSQDLKLEQEVAEFQSTMHEVLKWARYLAKTDTKGGTGSRIREFGRSRLPKDAGSLSFPPYFDAAFAPYTPPETWGR